MQALGGGGGIDYTTEIPGTLSIVELIWLLLGKVPFIITQPRGH